MRYYDVPVIYGTQEQQLQQIKEYLYRQTQDLNHNLQCVSAENMWRQTLDAVSDSDTSDMLEYDEEMLRRGEYVSLKGLIIKAATEILKYEDNVIKEYNAAYLAKSEFGEYFEKAKVVIDENAYGINELYTYSTQIKKETDTYITDLEAYIKRGVLEKDDSDPVFGLEIGYNKSNYIYNGKTYTNVNPSKIRITPTKIGFYVGSYEVAYIEKKAVYFPLAHITGGTIKIGAYFSVDEQGNMKATNADLTGTVNANAGYIGGFEITGLSKTTNEFWPCSIASTFVPSDDSSNEYAIFLRGNYGVGKTTYGVLSKANNLIGIKKRKVGSNSWSNDISPYTFCVSVLGNIYGNEIEVEGRINGKYIKANSDRIAIGMTDTSPYSKPIELQTSGEIIIGKYASKAENIYLLASKNIRIGQHSDESSESSGANYPSTNTVQIQAKTRIDIGSVPEKADKTQNIFLNAIYIRSNGSFIPAATATYNLGHSNYVWDKAYIRNLISDTENIYVCADMLPDESVTRNLGSAANKWNCIYSKYFSVKNDELIIGTQGSDVYTSNIYIRTQGYLLLGQDANPIDRAYIVASNTIRIGQYNDTLKTISVYVLGTTINITGASINLNGTVKVNGKTI